jgi:XTP/dITP diphosphohydrolase
MGKPSLRFVTHNRFKFQDAESVFRPLGVELIWLNHDIDELQTDTLRLVKNKALQAFKRFMRPLCVEHTGFYIPFLNGFPGGLTGSLWRELRPDRFAEVFGRLANTEATLKSVVAYIDYQGFEISEAELTGNITEPPRGSLDRPTDCVFIPKEYKDKVLSVLNEEGIDISSRRLAFRDLESKLRKRGAL